MFFMPCSTVTNLPAPAMKSLASGVSASRPSKSGNSPLERLEHTGDRALIFLARVDEAIMLALRAVRVRSYSTRTGSARSEVSCA